VILGLTIAVRITLIISFDLGVLGVTLESEFV